ncbi:hypothetical protein KIN20_001122 [Parelaphostrongylus tenuis]|uniref:Uncharacterized protein n=1 Tax=Parelaphostrongylus tenuis TaxID=148309 RepID=A0AAD5LWJ3_PARTN|nr:hypothetical protein KIN20_001122 [Parelaphostrongylus tenuis]
MDVIHQFCYYPIPENGLGAQCSDGNWSPRVARYVDQVSQYLLLADEPSAFRTLISHYKPTAFNCRGKKSEASE